MKKITALLLTLILIVSAAACTQKTAPTPSGEAPAGVSVSPSGTPITVTDMKGREITLSKRPEKIVALTPSDCEIVCALGAGGTLVGRGEYCDYPAKVLDIPSVQSGGDTNIEQVIALGPDVVIMSTMAQTEEHVTALENAGIKAIVTDAHDIKGVYTAITLIGTIVGKNDEAQAIIVNMKKTFDEIKAKVQADGGKTIYFEIAPLEYGLHAAGSGTFMDELAAMLGLTNIFADMQGWKQVSEEQVIQRNPDFIITTTMSYEGAQNPIDEVKNRIGWGDITAIKNGAVYNADSNAITRPGPRLVDAAQELYNFIYGGSAPSPSE